MAVICEVTAALPYNGRIPQLTPQDFVSKWKRVTAREKQTYQEHFIDLCRLAGHPTLVEKPA
ncbi:MAG: hypothetical protein FIB03_00105 [Anaerolineae bacterium]|nr:hypothetical protein [Anaerolineae bacterium]